MRGRNVLEDNDSLGEETEGEAAESEGGVGGREGEMEQQAQLPGGDRPPRDREGAGDVHAGGEGQLGGGEEHRQAPGCCWWSREVSAVTELRKHSRLLRTAFALS